MLFLVVHHLTHIGLGGPTGGGKTTTTRLLISQLLTDEVNATVYFDGNTREK